MSFHSTNRPQDNFIFSQFLSDIVLTRLLIGLYHLPRLQEIVLSVVSAKIMVLHDELKTSTFTWHSYLLSLNIDTMACMYQWI